MIWHCVPCDAYVSTREVNGEHVPIGTLADSKLRYWRKTTHREFDPLWKHKMKRDGCSKSKARNAGYAWLAKQMQLTKDECHIGKFDVSQCQQALHIIREIGRK